MSLDWLIQRLIAWRFSARAPYRSGENQKPQTWAGSMTRVGGVSFRFNESGLGDVSQTTGVGFSWIVTSGGEDPPKSEQPGRTTKKTRIGAALVFTRFDLDLVPDLSRRSSCLALNEPRLRLGEAIEPLSVFQDLGRFDFSVSGGLELLREDFLAFAFFLEVFLESLDLGLGQVGACSLGGRRDFGRDSIVDLGLDQEAAGGDHSAT
jgi:hypothetical protein